MKVTKELIRKIIFQGTIRELEERQLPLTAKEYIDWLAENEWVKFKDENEIDESDYIYLMGVWYSGNGERQPTGIMVKGHEFHNAFKEYIVDKFGVSIEDGFVLHGLRDAFLGHPVTHYFIKEFIIKYIDETINKYNEVYKGKRYKNRAEDRETNIEGFLRLKTYIIKNIVSIEHDKEKIEI